jgi:hypothetical protein
VVDGIVVDRMWSTGRDDGRRGDLVFPIDFGCVAGGAAAS